LGPGMAITISVVAAVASRRIRLRMLTHIRPTAARTFELSVKMPIDAWSRSTADAEAERLRHSVIPIIGADPRRRPYLVGSAVVLVYERFL
jgi:hypothetical protein